MMDKKAFGNAIKLLSGAYADERLMQENVVLSWYRYLGGYSENVLAMAIDDAIKNDSERPAVSELIELCEKYRFPCVLKEWLLHRCDGLHRVIPYGAEGYEEDQAAHPHEAGWMVFDKTEKDGEILDLISRSGVPVDDISFADYWVNDRLRISIQPRPVKGHV